MSRGKKEKDDSIKVFVNHDKKSEFADACDEDNISMSCRLEMAIDDVINERRQRLAMLQNPDLGLALSNEDKRALWDISRKNCESISETISRLITEESKK